MAVSATNHQKVTFYDVFQAQDEDCGICLGTQTGLKKAHKVPGSESEHTFHYDPCLKGAAKSSISRIGKFPCPICRIPIELTSVLSEEEIIESKKKIEESNLINRHMLKNAMLTLLVSTLFYTFQANQPFTLDFLITQINLPATALIAYIGLMDAFGRDIAIRRTTRVVDSWCTMSNLFYLVATPLLSTLISYQIPNATIYNITLPTSSIISAVALGIFAYIKGIITVTVLQPLNNQPN